MAPFPSPTTAPFLWHRPVCDCHFYYQYYLCGCPDRTAPMDAGHSCHVPCFQGCPMRYKPLWEQEMHHGYGFQHNPNPPTSSDPSVLPFPCYRHAVESCILLPPSALRNTRNRLMDPQWNPFSIQRKNRNMHMLQRFKDQGRSWEGKKRVREEEGDESSRRPPRKRRSKPETLELAQFRRRLQELELQGVVKDRFRSSPPPPPADDEPASRMLNDSPPQWYMAGVLVPTDANTPARRELDAPEPSSSSSSSSPSSRNSTTCSTPLTSSENSPIQSPPGSPPQAPAPALPTIALASQTVPTPPFILPPFLSSSPPTNSETTTTTTTTSSSSSPIPAPTASSSSSSSRNHFATLDWLLEEQSIDLWAQDGYRSRCPPPLAPREQQQQESGDGMVRDVVFDGNTHRGYHGGAYKLDHDVLHQARVANWSWLGDREGKLARAVGEWFRAGGGWWGRGLSME